MPPMLWKGQRYRIRWQSTHLVSLAGMQPKCEVRFGEVVGLLRHVRSSEPHGEGEVGVWVESSDADGPVVECCAKCGVREVLIRREQIVSVEPA